MPDINFTNLSEDPFNTIFSPYTDLLGPSFWLIPILIIAAALYVKTRNATTVSAYLLGIGVLFSSVSMFAGFPEMLPVFVVFIVIGIIGIIVSVMMEWRR